MIMVQQRGEVISTATATIADGSIDNDAMADDAIDSDQYVDGSIDNIHLADDAVDTAEIANDAVTADKLANSINAEIAANTAKTGITSGQANAITANTAKVTNATHTGDVTGATALTIAAGAVDMAMLATTAGTAGSGTFLRGDGQWQAATTSFIGIRVENSSNQSIANNSSVNIVFDASVTKFDTDTMHVSGNADRVTFTTAGKYWVGITYAYAGNSTGRRNVTCNKNGSVPLARQTITPATADEQHNGFNFIYEFSAGDYVVFTAHQNSGSALNIMADNENATVAMAYKIG
jgi:hypothetical protein